jgi:hypothetical protein
MLSAVPPKRNGTNVRPVSMATIADMTGPRAMPPYSSGVLMPHQPPALALLCNSASCPGSSGGRPERSLRRTCGSSGMTSCWMNWRIVSRTARSSSDSEKSIMN